MFIRVVIFLAGMIAFGLGVAFVTHAGLGTNPISSLALVLSIKTGLTIGTFLFACNIIFWGVQSIVNRKHVIKTFLHQMPICVLLSVIIDGAMYLTSWMHSPNYVVSVLMVLLGTMFVGLGIACLVYARLVVLPPDGMVLAIIHRFGGSFGTLRSGVDIVLVTLAIITSFIFFGRLEGVREGTIAAALMGGHFAKFFLMISGRLFPAHRPVDS